MPHVRLISIRLLFAAIAVASAGFAVPPAPQQANRGPSQSRPSKSASPRRAPAKTAAAASRTKKNPPAARRRDPFAPLLSDQPKQGKKVIRPPGKAGLEIDAIEVQGTVSGPRGAVAVVSSPDGHVYFLRPGDQLFDGTVERIELNDVVFIQHARDAFGRAFDRRVSRPVQSSEGAKP